MTRTKRKYSVPNKATGNVDCVEILISNGEVGVIFALRRVMVKICECKERVLSDLLNFYNYCFVSSIR